MAMESQRHAMSTFLFVSHLILAIAYSSFSCPIYCKKEINLGLFLHQVVTGPTHNQEAIVPSPFLQGFGTMAVNDWTVIDAPNPTATIVARAKGMHVQADQANTGWFTYLTIVFQDSRFTGSTLVAMGITNADGQWAIVSGTGEFANSHGIIKYKIVKNTPNVECYRKLDIHAFYNPDIVNATGRVIQ